MKAKLDRVNPGSIPNFLRDQNMDATDAKSLGVSSVGKPELDKDGTRESLAEDKDYQSKKNSQYLAKALFTPFGPFGGGSNSATDPASLSATPPDPDNGGARSFSDPNDAQNLLEIGLQDYIATEGYGVECGCTLKAPCCCLSPSFFKGRQCPMYGPFLPGDPCGAVIDSGGAAGDFPPANAASKSM